MFTPETTLIQPYSPDQPDIRHMVFAHLTVRLKFCLCLLTAFFPFSAFSTEYILTNYTVEDGLPTSELYNAVQDRNGYLWFSSDHGIIRYDGYEFTTFTTENGLPENVVLRLYRQSDGNIWGSTINGKLFYFSDQDYVFHTYAFNHLIQRRRQTNYVVSLYITSDKSVYISQYATGLTRIDSAGNPSYYFDPDSLAKDYGPAYLIGLREKNTSHTSSLVFKTFFPERHIPLLTDFMSDTVNLGIEEFSRPHFSLVWQSGEKPVYTYYQCLINKTGGRRSTFGSRLYGMGMLSDSSIWVGEMEHGVKVYDLSGKYVDSFLEGQTVTDILIDHAKGIWITTLYSGIFYIRNPAFRKADIPDEYAHGVRRISTGPSDEVYLTYQVSQMIYDVGNKRELYPNLRSRVFINSRVFHRPVTREDYTNRVLIGDTVVHVETAYNARDLTEDPISGEVYLINQVGCFDVISSDYRINRYEFNHRLHAICNSGNGGWYIGTSEGLYHYSSDGTSEFLGDRNEVFGSRITAIRRTPVFHIFSTRESGLVVMNADTLFVISRTEGLNTQSIESIYQENDSVFWTCSNSGIGRVSFEPDMSYSIRNISITDGLLSNEIRDIAVSDGQVWAATSTGVCIFRYSDLTPAPEDIGYLRVNNLYVNNMPVPSSFPLSLSYTENNLRFRFRDILFKDPGNVRYRYKVSGLESDWNYTQSRQAIYPSLPPGTYRFIVESDLLGYGAFGNAVTIPFTIRKPYYSTWWFRTLWISLLGAVIYSFFKIRILVYNRDILRELLRYMLKRLKRKERVVVIKDKGQTVRIISGDILYMQSSGNYLDIVTPGQTYTIRAKIGEVLNTFPDPLEFQRVHRSYIIRLDKVYKFTRKSVTLADGTLIPVGSSYDTSNIKAGFIS